MNWISVAPENYTLCKIRIFDDGRKKYTKYDNNWYVIGTNNRGKIRLKNVSNDNILLDISDWKVIHFNDQNVPE